MIFADTYYYLAILNDREQGHHKAVELSKNLRGRVLTTEWIIAELGDACSEIERRPRFLAVLDIMKSDQDLQILPATSAGLDTGIELFSNRADKQWPLTDCISFEAMREHGVTEALTADHHFAQAGFVPLLA